MTPKTLRFRINQFNEIREGNSEVLGSRILTNAVLKHQEQIDTSEGKYTLSGISQKPDSTRIISYKRL